MERIRTTVSLPVNTLNTFKKMAEVSGISMARCVSGWLEDTTPAAEAALSQLMEVRNRPRLILEQMINQSQGKGTKI
jgi:hypothetical protein